MKNDKISVSKKEMYREHMGGKGEKGIVKLLRNGTAKERKAEARKQALEAKKYK